MVADSDYKEVPEGFVRQEDYDHLVQLLQAQENRVIRAKVLMNTWYGQCPLVVDLEDVVLCLRTALK